MTDLSLSEPIRLHGVRARFAERDAPDLPDPVVTSEIDSEGMVTRVRALSIEETLDLLTRDVRGTVE